MLLFCITFRFTNLSILQNLTVRTELFPLEWDLQYLELVLEDGENAEILCYDEARELERSYNDCFCGIGALLVLELQTFRHGCDVKLHFI